MQLYNLNNIDHDRLHDTKLGEPNDNIFLFHGWESQ